MILGDRLAFEARETGRGKNFILRSEYPDGFIARESELGRKISLGTGACHRDAPADQIAFLAPCEIGTDPVGIVQDSGSLLSDRFRREKAGSGLPLRS